MKAARVRESFLLDLGREPSVLEVAEQLSVSPEEAAEAMTAGMTPLSLTYSEDGEHTDGQIDLPVDPPDEQLTDKLALMQVLTELEPRDRALLTLRYFRRCTQSGTAEKLGMTQVQVSRRERYLLKWMREKLIG